MPTITDPNVFKGVIRAMVEKDCCAIDTETTGVKPFEGDRICSVSLYHPEVGAYSVPVRMQGLWAENMPEEALSELQVLMHGTTLIGHNLSHDLNFFRVEGLQVEEADIYDTMYASFLYNDSLPSYALKGKKQGRPSVSETILGIADNDELDQLNLWRKGHPNASFDYAPWEILGPYSEKDVVLSWDLEQKITPELLGRADVYQTILPAEMEWVKLITTMGSHGLLFDFDRAKEIRKSHQDRMLAIQQRLNDECWPGFNPNSPQSVMSLMRNNDIDAPDTEVGTLWLYTDRLPILKEVIICRQLGKTLTSYVNKWELQVRKSGGRLYASWGATGHGYGDDFGQARTGRLRARNPNLMGVPSYDGDIHREKEVFCAPDQWIYGAVDIKQADIRVAAHYLQDKRLTEVLSDPTGDIHGAVAEDIGIPRIRAKRVVLGSGLYGAGASKTSAVMTDESHQLVTEAQAAKFIAAFQRRYPKFKFMHKQVEQAVRQRGWIKLWNGRTMFCGPSDDPHKFWNYLIQGGVAALMKGWMLDINQYLAAHRMRSRIVLQIHDEVVLEMPQEEVDALDDLAKLIEGIGPANGWRVPLFTKTKVGERWSDL